MTLPPPIYQFKSSSIRICVQNSIGLKGQYMCILLWHLDDENILNRYNKVIV